MKTGVKFTMKETIRYGVIEALIRGSMTNAEAADCLGLSKRQIQRIKKRVLTVGPQGVVHGNKGKRSHRAFSDDLRRKVIELARSKYAGFNFSHLVEFLEEKESIRVSRETARKWLRAEGLGRRKRRVAKHRKRRERSKQEGRMLFLDGSPHQWYGNKISTLILSTDDATGKPLYGTFRDNEDLDGCFFVCMEVFKRYGLPGCFYLDRASQFTTTRHKGVHVQQSDSNPTQFERAMQELGIHLIFATSPQARGRGERINGTFQDRLVAELALHSITDQKEAESYLNEVFIPRYQNRFGVAPEISNPAWRPVPDPSNLKNILCRRFTRKVTNDNTISINGEILQILPSHGRAHFIRAKVLVNQWIDGSYHVFHPTYGELPITELGKRSVRPKERGRSEPQIAQDRRAKRERSLSYVL